MTLPLARIGDRNCSCASCGDVADRLLNNVCITLPINGYRQHSIHRVAVLLWMSGLVTLYLLTAIAHLDCYRSFLNSLTRALPPAPVCIASLASLEALITVPGAGLPCRLLVPYPGACAIPGLPGGCTLLPRV